MTLVLATDFTDTDDQAADYALALADQLDARLVIVHAYAQCADAKVEFSYTPLGLKRLCERLIQSSKGSVDVSAVAKYGEPRDCIEAVVAEQRADLLVMALADTKPYVTQVLGSLPTDMIPQAAVSTLILPPGDHGKPVKTVVLALDLSEAVDALVLGKAKELVRQLGAVLDIISMDSNPAPQRQEAAQRIGWLFDGLPHTFHFLPGTNLTNALGDHLATHPADLIMMLPKHHNLLATWLLQSVTQQVARKALVPVLAVV